MRNCSHAPVSKMADRFPELHARERVRYENKLDDRMIKQILNSLIARYRDLSVSRRLIMYLLIMTNHDILLSLVQLLLIICSTLAHYPRWMRLSQPKEVIFFRELFFFNSSEAREIERRRSGRKYCICLLLQAPLLLPLRFGSFLSPRLIFRLRFRQTQHKIEGLWTA